MKSLIDFEATQPLVTRFFTHALESQRMVNAYVLCGRDLVTAYRMILRLAQILNCQQRPLPTAACGQCQPCHWIADNAHPGVITLTNLTYTLEVDPETGAAKSKTGKPPKSILVGQLETLLKELSLHSGGFHRIVIIAGAEETLSPRAEASGLPVPRDWKPSEEGQFQLLPLDRKLFSDALANKFLKTLEEPPLDTLFFLLTDSEQKLLETVVSRCQRIPMQPPVDFGKVQLATPLQSAFAKLLQPTTDYLEKVQLFSATVAEHQLSVTEGILSFQQFIWQDFQQAPGDAARFATSLASIRHLDQAYRMLESKTREEAVLEDLFLHFSQGAIAEAVHPLG